LLTLFASLCFPCSCCSEIPLDAIRTNPHIVLATTRRGGHVAWARGSNPLARGSSWMITTTLQCQWHNQAR